MLIENKPGVFWINFSWNVIVKVQNENILTLREILSSFLQGSYGDAAQSSCGIRSKSLMKHLPYFPAVIFNSCFVIVFDNLLVSSIRQESFVVSFDLKILRRITMGSVKIWESILTMASAVSMNLLDEIIVFHIFLDNTRT